MIKKIALVLAAFTLAIGLAACETEDTGDKQYSSVEKQAQKRKAYIPHNSVEFNNYNKAQELYDSPDSIIWCTTTWGNANAPLVTVPIAGKLTSSSVSYFSNNKVRKSTNGNLNVEKRSVDGMFHGQPGPYRYGFTPGGQYVDFTNMPTFCTTALTKFQREKTQITVTTDDRADSAQNKAEAALKSGDPKAAEKALEGVESVDSQ